MYIHFWTGGQAFAEAIFYLKLNAISNSKGENRRVTNGFDGFKMTLMTTQELRLRFCPIIIDIISLFGISKHQRCFESRFI